MNTELEKYRAILPDMRDAIVNITSDDGPETLRGVLSRIPEIGVSEHPIELEGVDTGSFWSRRTPVVRMLAAFDDFTSRDDDVDGHLEMGRLWSICQIWRIELARIVEYARDVRGGMGDRGY